MKAKTIQTTIASKMADWLLTLPEELRDQVEKDIVVTGGSIASMFLQENVNDYDMYFRSIKTVLLVSRHYCKKWNTDYDSHLTPELRITFDGLMPLEDYDDELCFENHSFTYENGQKERRNDDDRFIISPYASDLDEIINNHVDKVKRVEIFIRSEGICDSSDDELEVQNKITEDIHKAVEDHEKDEENTKYNIRYLSSNAITLSDKVQIVIRFYGEPSEIHDTYDFVHATNYWTHDDGLVTNTRALEAILSRELIYTGSKYPLASIFRTRKFILRNWSCHVGNYLKMAIQLNEFNLFDHEVLQEQLTGVDAAYLNGVISAVRTKIKDNPGFQFNAMYLCEVCDRLMGESRDDSDKAEEEK